MSIRELEPGDIVYAAHDLHNDGSIPGLAEDATLARQGTRGVIINTGHLEHDPDTEIYLVRFEDAQHDLGLPIGCLEDDLSMTQTSA